jgi:hypothetical protein
MVKWLVEDGNATVDLQLKHGKYETALEVAKAFGNTEISEWLTEREKKRLGMWTSNDYN